ncbi:MAG: transposase [Nitrosomonas sp.]|nr:transposase [Nitrosomonas sp.]
MQRGERQQDAYVERYNRIVRHEWLEMNEFATIVRGPVCRYTMVMDL